jgi:hypothetical protein
MRFRTAVALAAAFMVCFAIAVWSAPSSFDFYPQSTTPEVRTVSGRITAIGDAEFTLEVSQDQRQTKMRFVIDQSTGFDGMLSIAAKATVTFHSDSGTNNVTHITVTPSSEPDSH